MRQITMPGQSVIAFPAENRRPVIDEAANEVELQIGRFRLRAAARGTPQAFLAIGVMVGVILMGSALRIVVSRRF